MLIIWNLQDGVDIYTQELNRLIFVGKLRVRISEGRNFPFDLAFVGDGLVFHGSAEGDAVLCRLDEKVILETVVHDVTGERDRCHTNMERPLTFALNKEPLPFKP